MQLVVGLGNPGNNFKKTIHNVGFIILDKFAEQNNLNWKFEKKFNAEFAKIGDTVLLKPQTYMNNSGESVKKAVSYYDVDLDNLIVIHDDVDFPAFETHIQVGKNSAGHKGVQDIIDMLGTNNFKRVRVGVGRPENSHIDTEDWVLTELSNENLGRLTQEFDYSII